MHHGIHHQAHCTQQTQQWLKLGMLQVAVGVGTLAGSSIMLLTAAWGGSLLAGRCDLDDKVGPLTPTVMVPRVVNDNQLRVVTWPTTLRSLRDRSGLRGLSLRRWPGFLI